MRYLLKTLEFIKSPGSMATITIVSLVFAIYATLFYERRPAISFEITSNANVYDIHEKLGKLDVIYSGKSLRANNQNLKLLNFRIVNSGQTSFLINDYDETDKLGFAIKGGSILELPKFIGSTEYLQTHVKPTLVDSNQITIDPIILEAGEYIEVHALILTHMGTEPIVQPLGKLAGVKKIQVIESSQPKDQRSFWSQVIEANSLWVQVARAPIYGLLLFLLVALLVLLVVLVVVPISSLVEFKKKREREDKMKIYSQGKPLSVSDRYVIEQYVENGNSALKQLIRLLYRISNRNDLVSAISDRVNKNKMKHILVSTFPLRRIQLDMLIKEGLAKENGAAIEIEPALERALNEISQFVGISLETSKFEYLPEDVDYHSLEMLRARKSLEESHIETIE